MKHALFYITIFFCLINNAFAMESDERILIHRESMENGSASSIGMYSGNDGIIYAGLSLNYITSSTVIQYDNRKTIYPLYVFVGVKAPWKLSPYIEAGADLPEAIIEDLLDELDDNENKSVSEIDFYYSGGLEFSVTDRFSFSLYAKKYNFIFRENYLAPISRARPNSYGMRVIIGF